MKTEKPKGISSGFILIVGLLTASLITGSYFLIRRKQRFSSPEMKDPEKDPIPKASIASKRPHAVRHDRFPLRRGSKGERVRQVQLALIQKFGAGILPQYGADGDWGAETEKALQSMSWPLLITEKMFSSYFKKETGQSLHALAWNLHQAAKNKDWAGVDSLLRKLHNISDYIAIRTSFLQWAFRGTANYTPVSALLYAFPDRRSELESHFARMGLRKKGEKWSLSGLPFLGRKLKTQKRTWIWSEELSLEIPAELFIGQALRSRGGITEFQNGKGEHFFVHSKDVSLL